MLFHAILSDNKKANTLQRATINYYNPIFAKKNNKTFYGKWHSHSHTHILIDRYTQTLFLSHTRKYTERENCAFYKICCLDSHPSVLNRNEILFIIHYIFVAKKYFLRSEKSGFEKNNRRPVIRHFCHFFIKQVFFNFLFSIHCIL